MFLNLSLAHVFSWVDPSYAFLAGMPLNWSCVLLIALYQKAHYIILAKNSTLESLSWLWAWCPTGHEGMFPTSGFMSYNCGQKGAHPCSDTTCLKAGEVESPDCPVAPSILANSHQLPEARPPSQQLTVDSGMSSASISRKTQTADPKKQWTK